jgi:bacillithiol biosynthesis cysteine-adding enzyme BshC
MQVHKIPFEATHSFSSFFLDYVNQKESLKPFYHRFPDIENFNGQLNVKSASFPVSHRNTLVKALTSQYDGYTLSDQVKSQIARLADQNTFTVTTGHQLNIFTGPLYFIYKIVTVINTCRKLKEIYPAYNFVPVYWMASEDHDYEEIKSFRLYGKKYTWETRQQGAVGRFNTSDFNQLLSEIPGDINLFRDAYTKHDTLSKAVRFYVNELFGNDGVVVIDGDDRELKHQFASIIEDDLLQHTTRQKVDATSAALEKEGYKTQVYCREINLFYLDKSLRSRIEKSNGQYTVVDTNLSFSANDLKVAVKNTPEKFSPNVILRPLYQETILPNLAYVGGPAEVVYWLQLKSIFDFHQLPFPILIPRNFAMVMDGPAVRKFAKTGISLVDLFLDKDALLRLAVLNFTENNIQLLQEKAQITEHFQAIRMNAEKIDFTLGPLVGAETTRVLRILERIEQKLLKAEKRLQSDRLQQIEAVKDALFPNGGLQERTDNFLNFYQADPQFIQKLIDCLDPFDFKFNVLQHT